MNLEILRKDMQMLEKGINMSNQAKREKATAKETDESELRRLKRLKNIKGFLRKHRDIPSFRICPKNFLRSQQNKTHLVNTGGKQSLVWTLELRLLGQSLTISGVEEQRTLKSIVNFDFLVKQDFD